MKKKLMLFLLTASISLTFTGCEGLFEEEEEDMVTDNSTYNYKFTCYSGGPTYTVPIPNRLSAACKLNWEYYARTYGCNDANNFANAEAKKRACP